MKFQKTLTLLTAAFLTLTISGRVLRAEAATQPASNNSALPGDDRMDKLKDFFATLDLSDDQKSQLKDILQPFREAMQKWREDHKDEIANVKSEIQAAREAKDRQKMMAALQDLKTLMATAPSFKDLVTKIEGVLNADQKAKFEQKLAELKDQRRARAQDDNK